MNSNNYNLREAIKNMVKPISRRLNCKSEIKLVFTSLSHHYILVDQWKNIGYNRVSHKLTEMVNHISISFNVFRAFEILTCH